MKCLCLPEESAAFISDAGTPQLVLAAVKQGASAGGVVLSAAATAVTVKMVRSKTMTAECRLQNAE